MGLITLLLLIFQIYLIATVIVLLLDNREPTETFAWILIFILMPGFGFALYLIVGRNWRRAYDNKSRLPQAVAKQLLQIFLPLRDLSESKAERVQLKDHFIEAKLVELLKNNSHSYLTTENRVQFFHQGADKFDALKKDLRAAKRFIHLEYFIWYSDDALGQELKEILLEKVRAGVEVRILYDFSGSLFTLCGDYVKEMREAGIEAYPFFNYLSNFKIHTINYRNHRKIAVIDGTIGYTGGMNVGQEYIDGGKEFDAWRDTHMRVEGEAASVLQAVFAIDWYNTVSNDDIFDEKYYPVDFEQSMDHPPVAMQLPTSGFDSQWPSILHAYFTLITSARKNVYISSPYFVPEPSIVMALKTAAMRGVDVKLLLTGNPDKPRITYWAAFSYLEDLIRAGVKIYFYQPGFFHAKIFSCDGQMCSLGTANLDIRSFRLNYEINAVIYNTELTQELDRQFTIDLDNSTEFTLKDFSQLSLPIKLRNSLCRLVSPIL